MEACKQEVPPDVSIDDVLIKCHLYSGVEAISDEDIRATQRRGTAAGHPDP